MRVYVVVLETTDASFALTREPIVVYADMGKAEEHCEEQQKRADPGERWVVWNMSVVK